LRFEKLGLVETFYIDKGFVDGLMLGNIALMQWFSTWSRWTTGCPPGISSGPQRVPQILDKTFL